ncbi:thioredoxin family protein [uncultured Flavobacterium sp.]|uniref:thioredoxin family protein n=1 Tax=uncultured Flavobacterium sp. TaxID=165435 RepID=UPI0030EB2B03|tara:strand:- start:84719 stop:85153 length:435 start_codon:yes stop_codon:yes gene_type:complete
MYKVLVIICLLVTSLVSAQDWKTSFDEAKIDATNESKNIILVFSGSDWCAPCIKLDKSIWQSEAFKQAASENWILLKADFPKKKANALSEEQTKINQELAEKYNPEGSFPKVVILNNEGKVLGIMGYEKITDKEYILKLKSFNK